MHVACLIEVHSVWAGATRRADGRGAAIHISREGLGSVGAIGVGLGAIQASGGAEADILFSYSGNTLPHRLRNGWGPPSVVYLPSIQHWDTCHRAYHQNDFIATTNRC